MKRWWGVLRSLVVYWRPGRQRGLRSLYRPFVEEGDLVFDVGAHLGDRTAAFHSLGARVVSLEPQAHLIPWLDRLVGRRKGVTVRQTAVGAREGSLSLWVSPTNPTVSTVAGEWKDRVTEANPGFRDVRWDEEERVPCTTLDALIEEFGEPAFCKIDVEGHEAEVLAGLSRPVPALSVEFVAGTLDVPLRCVHRLEDLGRYAYNVVSGEARHYLLEEWADADEISAWLAAGAGSVASGDLYARRRAAGSPPPPLSSPPRTP